VKVTGYGLYFHHIYKGFCFFVDWRFSQH
jgi:hypothetical protein